MQNKNRETKCDEFESCSWERDETASIELMSVCQRRQSLHVADGGDGRVLLSMKMTGCCSIDCARGCGMRLRLLCSYRRVGANEVCSLLTGRLCRRSRA